MVRYIIGSDPQSVSSAQSQLVPNFKNEESKRNIDIGTTASLAFRDDITGSIACHSQLPGWGPFGLLPRIPDLHLEVVCERGTIRIYNYIAPNLYHYISVTHKEGKKRTEKVHKYADGYGEASWTTWVFLKALCYESPTQRTRCQQIQISARSLRRQGERPGAEALD